jgi:regulator of protease activity HflC (stomatin/prohibitin superfamily)
MMKDAISNAYFNANEGETANRNGAILFSVMLFVLAFFVALLCAWLIQAQVNIWALIIALIVALATVSTVHIAQQWEKVVILRLGKFNRVAGPGLYCTVPVLESGAMRVDMRVRTTTFGAEETLSSDLVPLNVDAVLFWMVWDAKLACTEVGDFARAVNLAAQTALRDAIGRATVAEVAIRRPQLDKELRKVLAEKVASWGITILSVEVRDILVPSDLQDAMSFEAQAEQRKKARIILMEAEQDICEMMAEMGDTYAKHDFALRLRMMHLLYESVKDTGGTVVIPSSVAQAFSDIRPDELSTLFKKSVGA